MSVDSQAEAISAGVREGDVLAGKYRIDKVLGIGGMGVVVAGRHLQLDERVAVKFLLPQALANAEAIARFSREARAAVKIKSEHVARVSDVGTLENGAPYMVMEYLEGGDLSGWIQDKGPMPVEQAVDFILQACEAIAEAHALGIVHRDLKPANLFVIRRPDGTLSIKVLDFGISKMTGVAGTGSDMTRTSAIMGSPLYMSPEQMQSSKDVDARTDIWALGAVLYELLAGESAFDAAGMPELVLKIMTAPPAPLRDKRPDAPEGIERVILKCLEKDRGQRYASVADMAIALVDFGSKRARASVERISGVLREAGLSTSALTVPASAGTAAPNSGTAASWGQTGQTTSSGSSGRGPKIAAAAAVLLLVGGVASRLVTKSTEVSPEVLRSSGPPSAAPAPVRPPDPVPAVAPATAAEKMLSSDPAEAIVSIGGAEVGKTPHKISVPQGGVQVSLRAPGYRDLTRTIAANDPDDLRLTLERLPPAAEKKSTQAHVGSPHMKLAPR